MAHDSRSRNVSNRGMETRTLKKRVLRDPRNKQVMPKKLSVRQPRPTGTTKTKRSMETVAWKQKWEGLRKACKAERFRQLETYIAGKCPGYRYIYTIYAHTCNDTLAEA